MTYSCDFCNVKANKLAYCNLAYLFVLLRMHDKHIGGRINFELQTINYLLNYTSIKRKYIVIYFKFQL